MQMGSISPVFGGYLLLGRELGNGKHLKLKEKCRNLSAAVKALIRENQLPFPAQLWDRDFASPSVFNFLAAAWTELRKPNTFPHMITGPFPGVSMETSCFLKYLLLPLVEETQTADFPMTSSSLWTGCLLIDPPDQGLSHTPAWQLLCYRLKQQLNSKSHHRTQAWTMKSPKSSFCSSPGLGEAMG